jgi:hypothetical protein
MWVRLMAERTLKLDEADNPDYYNLWREHNELDKRWDEINNQIHEIRIPKFAIWQAHKKIKGIGRELVALQESYLKWRNKAVNFQMNPHYEIVRDENTPIVYLQATANMRNLSDRLESKMILLGNNHNLVHNQLDNRFSFLIAMGSFVLSFLAFVISLITLSDNLLIPILFP